MENVELDFHTIPFSARPWKKEKLDIWDAVNR
jgi:hypothetical protein